MARGYQLEKKILRQYAAGSINSESVDILRTKLGEYFGQFIDKDQFEVLSPSRLFLHAQPHNMIINKSEMVKILNSVIRTRGLVRWLCLNLFSSEISEFRESYFLSRREIIILLFRHRTLVREKIAKHLSYSDLNESNIQFQKVNQNDYFRAMFIGRTTLKEKSMLFTKSRYEIHEKNSSKKSKLLGRLIKADNESLKLFLLECAFDGFLYEHLQVLFPDAWDFINSKTKFEVYRLPNAEKTFDEVAQNDFANLHGDMVTDIEIWHQRFLVKGNRLLEFDVTGSHLNKFVAGHWQFLYASKILPEVAFLEVPECVLPFVDEAIFLSNRADENWYHLLLDTLPRYLFLKNLPADIPILIRDDLPVTSIEFLEKLFGRQLIRIPPNSRLRINKLHFLAARSTVFDANENTFGARVKFSPKTIGLVSSWIKDSLNVEYLKDEPSNSYLIRRSRQRRLVNSRKISKVATGAGFLTIADNEDFYRHQISTFTNLDTVISPGGAVLANMVFMKPGSKVLCLRSWRQNRLELWKKLAIASDIKYFDVVGLPTYFGINFLRREHANFYIVPWMLRKTLEEVIESKTWVT